MRKLLVLAQELEDAIAEQQWSTASKINAEIATILKTYEYAC
jgi:hypothetical protein